VGHYTIAEIAKLCNTSQATVSRVLNRPNLVAEPLRSRIRRTMEEVGYRPHPFASRLSPQSRWGLALFVFDILNPFFAMMVRRIGHLAMQKGIPLTVCDTECNVQKESLYLDHLLENRIAGIIFGEGISRATIDRARAATETVLIDRHFEEVQVTEISSDNYSGGCQATEYLLQLGHRSIGFIGGPEGWASSEDRLRGYCDTLANYGIPCRRELVFRGDLRFESGIDALEYFLTLSQWPSALFCANDQMAFGVLTRARSLNIVVPDDLSVIGFDNAAPHGFGTRLTTVQQDVQSLCSTAFEIMLQRIDTQQETPERSRVLIPTSLSIGETSAKFSPKRPSLGPNHLAG
jgi:DNA-binding LacI/PurR family transcriptional regulator